MQRRVERGRTVEVAVPPGVTAVYSHGWQSWSETRWRSVDEPMLPIRHPSHRTMHADPVHVGDPRPGGSGLAAARTDEGAVLGVACLGLGGWVSLGDAALHGTTEGDEVEWLVVEGTEDEVFAAIATGLAETFGRRSGRRPRTWSSWYSMYADIDRESLQDVLEGLDGLPFDVFQVDDGWQRAIGDWEVDHDRFPDDLAGLVASIRRTGREAGLWLAPFILAADSETATTHPEWLLRDQDGCPVSAGHNWGVDTRALDLTRPDVLDHVRSVVRAAVDRGFTYLKLDFLYAGALPGLHHRPRPRERAYRDGIEAIRDAVGEETYLLACGAPLVASLGVFDGARIGPDVAEHWEQGEFTRYARTVGGPNTRWAVSTSANRLWMQTLWDCDPDVVYFRSRACLLTREQQAILHDLATVTGFRATSDRPDWLTDGERDRLANWLAQDPPVRRTGPLTAEIGGRTVDFGPHATMAPDYDPDLP